MYENLVDLPQDFGFTPNRVDWHYGSRKESVQRVKLAVIGAVYEGRGPIETLGPKLLGWISDTKMLREAWNHLAAKGETAPGPNGHRYGDYDESEVWSKLKAIGVAIRKDTYRPGGERRVKIPKDRTNPERGTRTLTLIDIEDRVVERAVIEVLQPLFESLLGRNVLGFRVRKGRLHALALAEQQMVAEGRCVLVVEDLANAFDHVPINRLLDVLALYIPSNEVLRLLRRLLDTGRTHGIRQGGPLSPILLNIYLRHFLDEPWRTKWATTPMIRVVDDLLLLCQTKKEAEQARAGLSELLNPAGMQLKIPKDPSERTVFDSRKGATATWLGFIIGKGDEGFTVQIADRAWRRLEELLMLAHEKPDSAVRAVATINGWIDQLGPCYPFVQRPQVYRKVAEVAAKWAFDEIPSRDAVTSRWRRAYKRWCGLREAVRERPEVLDSPWVHGSNSACSSDVAPSHPDDPAVTPWE